MELPQHQTHTAAVPASSTMSNGHSHNHHNAHAGPSHAHPQHHRQTSSNGGSGFHPTEKTALMQQARSAYRLNDVEASRCVA